MEWAFGASFFVMSARLLRDVVAPFAGRRGVFCGTSWRRPLQTGLFGLCSFFEIALSPTEKPFDGADGLGRHIKSKYKKRVSPKRDLPVYSFSKIIAVLCAVFLRISQTVKPVQHLAQILLRSHRFCSCGKLPAHKRPKRWK